MSAHTLEKTRIFVVEDQPQLLKNLIKVLALFSELEVVGTAQEGEDGVEQMVKLLPDLVLLDLELFAHRHSIVR